jgi:hypothetical protein
MARFGQASDELSLGDLCCRPHLDARSRMMRRDVEQQWVAWPGRDVGRSQRATCPAEPWMAFPRGARQGYLAAELLHGSAMGVAKRGSIRFRPDSHCPGDSSSVGHGPRWPTEAWASAAKSSTGLRRLVIESLRGAPDLTAADSRRRYRNTHLQLQRDADWSCSSAQRA